MLRHSSHELSAESQSPSLSPPEITADVVDPPTRLTELLEVVRQERVKLRSRVMWTAWLSLAYCLTLLAGVGAAGMITGHYPVTALAFLALLALAVIPVIPSRRHARAIRELIGLDDTRAVGPLIETIDAAGGFDASNRDTVRVARSLTKLLQRLTAADSHLLSAQHRRALNRRLAWPIEEPWHRDLAVAILRAYRQVGDTGALRAVRVLAQHKRRDLGGDPVRQAAAECLEHLEALAAREKFGRSLLRPAASPVAADLLMRPASHTPTETAALLRAADEPGPRCQA